MDAGLYVVKRTAQFVSKIAAAQRVCVREITKATENEKTKFERLRSDKNETHVGTVIFLQSLAERYTSRMDEFQNQVTQDIVKPLLNFRNEVQKRLSHLRKEHTKHQKKIDTLYNGMVKLHSEGMKVWQSIEQEKAKAAQGDDKGKHEKKLQSLGKKAQGIFRKYEAAVSSYRQAAEEHYDKIIVGLLAEMEKLERQRLEEMGNRLNLFAQLWNTLDSPLASSAELLDMAAELDPGLDLEQCVRKYAESEDLCSGIPDIPEHLPCRSSDFDSEKWRAPDPQPAQRQLVLQNIPSRNNRVQEHVLEGKAPESRYDNEYGSVMPEYGEDAEDGMEGGAGGGGNGGMLDGEGYDGSGSSMGYRGGGENGDGMAAEDGGVYDEQDTGEGGYAEEDYAMDGGIAGGMHGGGELYVQAVYPLETEDPDNLTFQEGDIIFVTSDDVDWEELQDAEPDWLTGYLMKDPERTLGQFPSQFFLPSSYPK